MIRNAKIEMFSPQAQAPGQGQGQQEQGQGQQRAYMRLAVEKWGLIEEAKEPLSCQVNTQRNLSANEYELILPAP